jgi:hypothetical protein
MPFYRGGNFNRANVRIGKCQNSFGRPTDFKKSAIIHTTRLKTLNTSFAIKCEFGNLLCTATLMIFKGT